MIKLCEIDSKMIANNIVPTYPVHPGEILYEEMEERGITQTRLAESIGVRISLLNELIHGKRSFTIEYAMLIEAALGIEADFWINLQNNYDKARTARDTSFMARLAAIRKVAAAL
ncbi:MAG: HigA family addiction module antidote protein [Muribaculaceae bacterium]|nr:HigA family addiction module antidote protein [Muribaculaceae bacterium]